jgi:AcrR family transcriptional regulator
MPRRSREEVERSQAAVLEAAIDVASREGLEALTLGRVAEATGLSKSGVIGRFGSKEALQLGTLAAAVERFVAEVVTPALEQPAGSRRLRALAEGYLDYLEREVFAGGCFLAAAAHEFDGRPGAVRDATRDALQRWVSLLEREARSAHLPEPAFVAFELQAIGLGANLSFQLLDDRTALRRARRAVRRVLAGP